MKPLPVVPNQDASARRTWWRGFELTPGVTLRTECNLRPSLACLKNNPWELLASLLRASSAALLLHPEINFYTFWGKLAWAGPEPRVQTFLERKDKACDSVVIKNAHDLTNKQLIRLLTQKRNGFSPDAYGRLKEQFPLSFYVLERFSGALKKRYQVENAALFVSMLGLTGIEELTFTPAHSMALYPSTIKNGTLKLTLCFNHQLANARPVARFLLTIKQLLE